MKPIFLNQENLLLKKWIKTVAYVEKQKYYYYKSRHSHSS